MDGDFDIVELVFFAKPGRGPSFAKDLDRVRRLALAPGATFEIDRAGDEITVRTYRVVAEVIAQGSGFAAKRCETVDQARKLVKREGQ